MDVRIIIVGFGNIGRSLAKTIVKKSKDLNRSGVKLSIVAICEASGCAVNESGINITKFLKSPVWEKKRTIDVIREVDAEIMVELTPGNIKTGEPGLSHIICALESGKDVVTSNKSPLATAYERIMDCARLNGKRIRFEASVGGAIPIIRTLEDESRVNEIRNVYGILNGTTNFILSKMESEGIDFDSALKEAQELGFAETDPSYDIDGKDTAAKLAILCNLIRGRGSISDIKVSGIRRITTDVMDLASDYGYAIRLVADMDNGLVCPRLVRKEHPLNVSSNLNAVTVETDLALGITLIGHGAGPQQTSSAILGDIIKLANS